jgi:hypothetical protein
MKKYIVKLTEEERIKLKIILSNGRVAAKKHQVANVLLLADAGENGPSNTDEEIHEIVGVSLKTIGRIRMQLVENGFDAPFTKKPYPSSSDLIFGGVEEAKLIALCCGKPPAGYGRWSLRLLSDRIVEMAVVKTTSHETVRQTLNKNELKPWRKKEWCIPPKANADFVCKMEDVLDVYKLPYDEKNPVICMDELSKQLTKETRPPIGMDSGNPMRYDTEYERNGTSNIFIAFEPLLSKRQLMVTNRRTKSDWAYFIKELVDVHYPHAFKIVLIMDNLNTHDGSSLYEAFEPAEAKRILNKLEIHHTPKHGSWLNMAELELSHLSRQCLDRRIPDKEILEKEVAAWEKSRNKQNMKVDWHFTTKDARIKLKKLYPIITGVTGQN